MHQIICNTCQKTATPNSYGFAPDGWLSITVRGAPYGEPADYCSIACARLGLQAQLDTDREAALKAEVA